MTTAEDIAARDVPRTPVRVDVAYATITLGTATLWSVMGGWLLYYYMPPEGEGVTLVPAALFGAAMIVSRAVNAALAPPIGYLSDRTNSRWGRRLPYMFGSALPMAAFFVLLWTPPIRGQSVWNLLYLGVVLLGIIVPLVIAWYSYAVPEVSTALLLTGTVCEFVGGLATRYSMLRGGVISSVSIWLAA